MSKAAAAARSVASAGSRRETSPSRDRLLQSSTLYNVFGILTVMMLAIGNHAQSPMADHLPRKTMGLATDEDASPDAGAQLHQFALAHRPPTWAMRRSTACPAGEQRQVFPGDGRRADGRGGSGRAAARRAGRHRQLTTSSRPSAMLATARRFPASCRAFDLLTTASRGQRTAQVAAFLAFSFSNCDRRCRTPATRHLEGRECPGPASSEPAT